MIDWARVSELRDEIGVEDFAEVVELFLEEVEEEIDNLRQNIVVEKLEAQLHFLKGSALNLGFKDFSDQCQLGETAAAKGDYDAIDLPAILSCYDASKSEFLSALESSFAA